MRILLSLLFTLYTSHSTLFAASTAKPNVVIIYTDDHRYSGVHALGGEAVQTPHMDALSEEGVTFHNAYLMGSFSGATCIPSRATLLTGKSTFELHQPGKTIPPNHTTIGEAFQKAGYQTHIVGKWHQDYQSLARSFDSGDTLMGLSAYLVDHYRMPLWDWNISGNYPKKDAYLLEYDKKGKVVRRSLNEKDKRGPTGTETLGPHTSEIFADNAINYISKQKRAKDPFFMYLAFHAPHDPRQAPAKYKAMYPESEIELPPSYARIHPFDNGHIVLRDEELAPWPRTPEIARKELSDYYAIITHLDTQIGRVIKSLKESGQYENTLVVLCGDSGLAVGNHGLLGKQNVYDEDGLHVPLIFAGGVIENKGDNSDALCYTHDIFPTICDMVGIETPGSVSGHSFARILKGKSSIHRKHTYHAYMQYQRAFRKGDYKLIEYVKAPGENKQDGPHIRGSRVTQLFNYKTDPWETVNLAYFPEYEELIEEMRSQMKAEAKRLGDNKGALINYDFDFWESYK
ncbi:sulfatase-like hydrolase/transferase [Pelagicoccus mobilis]|uniref:Sulfatase-like hydrolase/transferase n=1 Tax=Pelagicoccus mobilis TaxID=415221 RepID=A0A934RUD5_9BACT|nr:sulfatase-like hydrolase/transferase [Pelagicoccus mobilis]MBK1875294.1 sulfatase-like hydrolase/transferase [Pelagicoccus mobilis]